MARSVSQYLRDLQTSKNAQVWYRRRARELRLEAQADSEADKPLAARRTRYYALICEHAAQAEFMDPETR